MNIVDSSGWMEYIADDANANFFESPLVDSENLIVPTFCLYEVFKRVLQEFGEKRALDVMGIVSLGTVIDLDRQIAIHAAQIANELKLAMADSIILATSRAHGVTLCTQDEHFKRIDGVRYKDKKPKTRHSAVGTAKSNNSIQISELFLFSSRTIVKSLYPQCRFSTVRSLPNQPAWTLEGRPPQP